MLLKFSNVQFPILISLKLFYLTQFMIVQEEQYKKVNTKGIIYMKEIN